MADKIQFMRGFEAQTPVLDAGEPYWAIDKGKLYIGTESSNVLIAVLQADDVQERDVIRELTDDEIDQALQETGLFNGAVTYKR